MSNIHAAFLVQLYHFMLERHCKYDQILNSRGSSTIYLHWVG